MKSGLSLWQGIRISHISIYGRGHLRGAPGGSGGAPPSELTKTNEVEPYQTKYTSLKEIETQTKANVAMLAPVGKSDTKSTEISGNHLMLMESE